MRFSSFLLLSILFLTGCITPDAKNQRGLSSPMFNAYQAAQAPESVNPFSFPLSKQSQAYAFAAGALVLMVLIILKASQAKEK